MIVEKLKLNQINIWQGIILSNYEVNGVVY